MVPVSFPPTLPLVFEKVQDLRYGENPHQQAAFYRNPAATGSSVTWGEGTWFWPYMRMETGTHLELRIEDDGVGFDPAAHRPGHFGIVGLREQAELIGAELRIESRSGEGTKFIVSWRVSPVAFGP